MIGICRAMSNCQSAAAVRSSASWLIPKSAMGPSTRARASNDITIGKKALICLNDTCLAVMMTSSLFIVAFLLDYDLHWKKSIMDAFGLRALVCSLRSTQVLRDENGA